MKTIFLVIIPICIGSCYAFAPIRAKHPTRARPDIFELGASDFSRIEGNQREPNAQDIAIMDEMIRKMSDAKPYELPSAVKRAFRICSSPRFFLRIAELCDLEEDDSEKDKLSALATNLAVTVETVVATTKEQLDERAKDVEEVVKAASEPDSGEFLVPLATERVEAMRASLKSLEPFKLDENFLATVDAWIVKSHQDGMDGMVTILQKLLQQYAGLQVSRARAMQQKANNSPASVLLESLFASDPDFWESKILDGLNDGVTSSGLVAEIQRTMETVILALENGSMAQRIQAEYLKELVTRAEALQKS